MSTIDEKEISVDDVDVPQVANKLEKKLWTPIEDDALMNLINIHGIEWKTIAEHMPNRTAKKCRER